MTDETNIKIISIYSPLEINYGNIVHNMDFEFGDQIEINYQPPLKTGSTIIIGYVTYISTNNIAPFVISSLNGIKIIKYTGTIKKSFKMSIIYQKGSILDILGLIQKIQNGNFINYKEFIFKSEGYLYNYAYISLNPGDGIALKIPGQDILGNYGGTILLSLVNQV